MNPRRIARYPVFLNPAFLVLSCCALTAQARDVTWAAGISAGTLGVGPEVVCRIGERFGVRANAGFLSFNRSEDVDDIRYRGDADLRSYGLTADWYPFGGGFRISLGGRINDNEIGLEGRPATSVTVGDNVYTPEQIGTLTGTVSANDFSPALTLGYGGLIAPGFTLAFELGVLFQGSPRVANLQATGLLAGTPGLTADLEREQTRIEDEVHNYEYWPILQLQFLYRF